jgi:membrane protein required for colicin V production
MGDDMTLYDLIFLAMLAVFCFAGAMRGGIRSLIDVLAFFGGIFLAIVSVGFLRDAFHLDAVTGYIAAFIMFVVVFLAVRYLGHAISDKVQKQATLNVFDRVLGFGLGIFQALLLLGVFHLIFVHVTPIDKQPEWFTNAKVHNLSAQCAKTIQAFLPKGTSVADKVAPDVQK